MESFYIVPVRYTENEGNVEWFLKEYPEFELVKEKQMIPGRDAGDGFYIAILKRVNHE